MAIDILTEQISQHLVNAARAQLPVTEEELCRRLNVSRSLVRGSLEHLEKQGVVERRKNKGTSLRKPSIKEWVELWDFRTGIEGFAAHLACQNITASDLEELQTLIENRRRAGQEQDERTAEEYDMLFHKRMVELSRNSFLMTAVENLHLFERIFKIYYIVPSASFASIADNKSNFNHEMILKAVGAKDPDQAEQAMRFHIQDAKQRTLEAMLGRVNLFEERKSW